MTGCRTAIILRRGSGRAPAVDLLLFLKMADEQSRAPFNKRSPIPKDFAWQSLLKRDGDELETHYRHVFETLGKEKGIRAGRLHDERSNSITS